ATFRNGEILVLMSMDPDAPHAKRAFEDIAAKIAALRQRVPTLRSKDEADRLIKEFEDLERQRSVIPRGIVSHPAIVGRELAWTAARVDFWFNQMDTLSQEAAAINGGRPIPQNLRDLPIRQASTWQFYELNSVVRLGADDGKSRQLVVASKSP